LAALQSVIDIEVARLLGYSFPPRARRFQRLRGFPPMPVPRSLASTGSSSPELHLLFRVHSCVLPARYPRVPSASFRVSIPFATPAHEVHSMTSFPSSPTFRPQRFSRSRRLAPSRTLQAYFVLQPRPGFALQGFSPLPSRLASSTSRALMSLPGFSYRRVAPPAPDPPAPSSGP
jgi:hypothetical protein